MLHNQMVARVFLANVRSLLSKMDVIKLQDSNTWLESCITVKTETWLHENILDQDVENKLYNLIIFIIQNV